MQDSITYVPQPLRLTTSSETERVVIRAEGELDLATVEQVEREVLRCGAVEPGAVVLDLREVSFIDSTGLNTLLRLAAVAETDGFSFAIAEGDGPVRRLLDLTLLTSRFEHASL